MLSVDSIRRDFFYSLRSLKKSPGFAVLAILALALGIGANAAIFSVVYSLMFRPLPGATHPEELVSVVLDDGQSFPSAPDYVAFQDYASLKDVFVDAAGNMLGAGQLRVDNQIPERILPVLVSGNYFDLLGVKMAMGRAFHQQEVQNAGNANVAVIAYDFWKRHFAGNPNAIGSVVQVNGNAFNIIGVAAPDFHGSNALIRHSVFVPINAIDLLYPGEWKSINKRSRNGEYNFVGRLRPGVSMEKAQAAVTLMAERLSKEYPNIHQGQRATVYPEPRTRMETEAVSYLPPVTTIFMTLVGLVLLAACANVASLFYARASGRQKEIAIRLAIGAGRGQILQQLFTESLLLAFLGAVAGIMMAYWLIHLLASIRFATDLPLNFDFVIDKTVIGYSLILAVISGVLSALMPGLRISKTELAPILKEGGKTSGAGSTRQILRDALVVLQVAVSLVLLVCAGLFLQSTINSGNQDIGIQTKGRLVMAMDTEVLHYDEQRTRTFYRELLDRVRALPGVESASLGRYLPIGFQNGYYEIFIEGRPKEKDRSEGALFNIVGDDYFKTVGMTILQGRPFSVDDVPGSKPVAIINQMMAEKYWPGQDALGKRFRFDDEKKEPVEVIGVVKTGKYTLPAEGPTAAFYLPYEQNYRSDMVLHVYTLRDPQQMVATVRSEVLKLDPDMPLWDVRTLADHIRYGKMRLYDIGAGLIGGFGLIALVLAAVGLYGVMAYLVNQRTHEIGVRMALGATSRDVLKSVVANGMKKTVLGLLIGVPLAILATRSVQYLLVGVSLKDPLVLSIAILFLSAITLIAALVPGWRATRVDPLIALRSE
jgi:putative ABC transport system permease protein